MRATGPFHRSQALIALMVGAMSAGYGAMQAAKTLAGGYKSRGHGGKRAHRDTGIAKGRRAACKARNVKANRRAHK